MTATPKTWLQRHSTLALLAINATLLSLLTIGAELFLRIYIPYNPGYYTSVKGPGRDLVYPYGTIKINSEGFPDAEWDLRKSRRIGYFGDSVTYGVGAGYGYRISELLAAAYPEFEHMNFAGIGLSISESDVYWAAKLAEKYRLEKLVYLFNLNDIVPDAATTGTEQTAVSWTALWINEYLDWLRGTSYLYTFLRTKAKTLLEEHGVGFHGYAAFELFPSQNAEVIRQTAERINLFQRVLAERGVEFILVLLPYEMQISSEAEKTYAKLGIQWEPDFIAGATQRAVIGMLAPEVRHYDAYNAFVDPNHVDTSRATNHLGQFFVYDRGDKLDWNHPNRAGHRAIATYLASQGIFGSPDAPAHADAVNASR